MSKTTDLLSDATAKIEQIKKITDDNLNIIKELEAIISQIQTEEREHIWEQVNTAAPISEGNRQSKPELQPTKPRPTLKAWQSIENEEAFTEGYQLENTTPKSELSDAPNASDPKPKPTKRAWIK